MKRFDNRTAIIAGGPRGMGFSQARGFVSEGSNVLIADVLEQAGANAWSSDSQLRAKDLP